VMEVCSHAFSFVEWRRQQDDRSGSPWICIFDATITRATVAASLHKFSEHWSKIVLIVSHFYSTKIMKSETKMIFFCPLCGQYNRTPVRCQNIPWYATFGGYRSRWYEHVHLGISQLLNAEKMVAGGRLIFDAFSHCDHKKI
jgi:hypothetical protein